MLQYSPGSEGGASVFPGEFGECPTNGNLYLLTGNNLGVSYTWYGFGLKGQRSRIRLGLGLARIYQQAIYDSSQKNVRNTFRQSVGV